MASTYLTRTESSGNRKTGTLSFWVKRNGLGNGSLNQYVYSNWNVSVGGYLSGLVQFSSADSFEFSNYQESGTGTHTNLLTNKVFRDISAWYHIVVNWDTTQATSSDRYKMYINGVQETSFQTANYPSLNEDLYFNIGGASNPVVIGSNYGNSTYFDGSMSHYHFIDGTAYDASAFGEYDANGVWKINTSPSVTYGNNGFFILKNGNSVTDQSGNGNNFTVAGGTLTNTEDSPSNVFCTINALDNFYPNSTITNGNTTIATATSNRSYNTGTLSASSGKWYWEVKAVSNVQSSQGCYIGIASTNPITNGVSGTVQTLGYWPYDYSFVSANGNLLNNNTQTSYGNSYTDNDIVGVAMDLDNNKLYFSINGVWQNSGDPTSGATGTGAISIQDPSGTVNGVYSPGLGDFWVNGFTVSFNFGNGYFGTTAVASAGTNASGIGIFEYDVPTGYTALSTKGLNL